MYEYEEIFPAELEKWRNNGAQLVDVRERWEYEDAHIPGTNNVPLGELLERVDELEEPVVLVCASGNRSGQAAHYLTEHGILKNVANLMGGTAGWQARGLPVE
ncbi:MAG: rhodanese-like domain-containing protein [Rubrobacteraceae bacterium]